MSSVSAVYKPDTGGYLDFVLSNSTRGDASSVISAIDQYADTHTLMHIGNKKGSVIDDLISKQPVQVMVELGGYLGYSAVRFANKLPTNGHYYSFELNPEFAEVAGKIIEHAGLSSKVTIVLGEFQSTSKNFFQEYDVKEVQFVFIDHWQDLYVQDLKIIEELKWMQKGALVVADNVLYPGAPEYKAYIENHPETYESRMIEVEFSFRKGDKPVVDALLVAEFLG
ncbi:hypothetical protein K7432_016778 [Basidiobolus ranarum]|uniref:catechol O-methyltransferase n=1 Tax=Basidiobolus ranarum TaxID=34480 RepID=A0ABR2VL83_9FUNG